MDKFRIKWIRQWDTKEYCDFSPYYTFCDIRDGNKTRAECDVLYRLRAVRYANGTYRLVFGIDYIPAHYKTTVRGTLADCWKSLRNLATESDMIAIERDICGDVHNDHNAPQMLEYLRCLCDTQAANLDIPKN